MGVREDTVAILHYKNYQRMPIVHFGYWSETIEKWHREGHISDAESAGVYDNSANIEIISHRLGFDFSWSSMFAGNCGLNPRFEPKILEVLPDGNVKKLNAEGVIVIERPGNVSIPFEVDHLLKDRESWEQYYKPRLQMSPDRYAVEFLAPFRDTSKRDRPIGIHCGSLYGEIRNYLGVEGSSYLQVDDEDLFDEIINTNAQMHYELTEAILKTGAKADFGHFWEDICFKNGPLISPAVFAKKVGPWYRKICDLLLSYGVDIVSLDCDGMIDSLIPIWLENGVNTMFPIEVGTWNASIEPWRKKYGCAIRGVGGMNKTVFAKEYKDIDEEVERLKRLVDLGGYIPCPDHLIALDAKWENVQYYCEKMRNAFK